MSSELFGTSSFVSVVEASEGISISKLKSQLSVAPSFFSSAGTSKSIVISAAFETTCESSACWSLFHTPLKSKSHSTSFVLDCSCATSQDSSIVTSNEDDELFQSSLFSSVDCSDVISEKSKSKLSSVGLEILSNFSKLSKTSCEPPNSGFLASLAWSVDDTWFAELFAAVGLISAISFSYK